MKLMGTAMGGSFGQFGKLMQTPAFKTGLGGLLQNSVQFTNIVLPAFAGFLQMLGKVGGRRRRYRTGEPARRHRPRANRPSGRPVALHRADQPDVHGDGHHSCAP